MSILPATPPHIRPAKRARRRSNWGLRFGALLLSALAFLGFWQAAERVSAAPATGTGGQYAPPSGSQGGLLPASGLGPHGSTRVS